MCYRTFIPINIQHTRTSYRAPAIHIAIQHFRCRPRNCVWIVLDNIINLLWNRVAEEVILLRISRIYLIVIRWISLQECLATICVISPINIASCFAHKAHNLHHLILILNALRVSPQAIKSLEIPITLHPTQLCLIILYINRLSSYNPFCCVGVCHWFVLVVYYVCEPEEVAIRVNIRKYIIFPPLYIIFRKQFKRIIFLPSFTHIRVYCSSRHVTCNQTAIIPQWCV